MLLYLQVTDRIPIHKRTMYEPTEKKHYLCISKNKLVGRYLLQDNTKPAWHSEKRSTPERVQDAVDEMVVKVNESC